MSERVGSKNQERQAETGEAFENSFVHSKGLFS